MTIIDEKLIEKINRGPATLFLGQQYFLLNNGDDSFLFDILKKYGDISQSDLGYSSIFSNNWDIDKNEEDISAWLHNRSERISTPDWLKNIAGISWSHVFSSAIDTLWYKSFRNEWREIHPIYENKYYPLDIRNKIQLHCTFLYGSINRTEKSERAPLTKIDWYRRNIEAISLARRISEIVTPLGIFIIDGYNPNTDWFSIENFFPIIDQLNTEQTHFFNFQEKYLQNEIIKNLVSTKKIIPHNEPLSNFLCEAELTGRINLNYRPSEKFGDHIITCGNKNIGIPLEIWKNTIKSSIILDNELFISTQPLSKDKTYREFIEFLQDSSTIPVWSAYSRNFAFNRNYETELLVKTHKWLANFGRHNLPIILHGQSGTGKTIALGRLAYSIRQEANFPVLFIERKSVKPNYLDIDAFCKWVEDKGANCTLIIWDGMQEPDQYYDLLTYLLSRGRKVVIVGSCYREPQETIKYLKQKKNNNFILANSTISKDEISRFFDFLKQIDPDINLDYFLQTNTRFDSTFFVTLFRLLPSTRSKLRWQLDQEVKTAEQKLIKSASEKHLGIPETTLGYALWKANLIDTKNPLEVIIKEIDGEDLNRLEVLIGLIMVPGQMGIKVPIGLLLRALSAEWIESIEENLNIDIFKWYEDNIGNIFVGPRHALEAKLIVQSRMGGIETQLDYVEQLLIEIHDDDIQDGLEIQFAVDLVRALGPNGQDIKNYAPYFLKISQILTKIRQNRSIVSPRLMLQEASLIREAVTWSDKNKKPLDNSIELLNRAENVLRTALSNIEKNGKNERQKSNILVELGSTLGSKNRALINTQKINIDFKPTFFDAKELLFKAIALNPEDFHPVDVFIWMSSDILQSNALNYKESNEIKADIQFILNSFDPESLSPEQMERYYQKQDTVGVLLDDMELSESAIQKLDEVGSKAGFYIQANKLIGKLPTDEISDISIHKKISDGLNYLEKNKVKIKDDGRCLSMLLKLWWLNHTGRPFFYNERQTVVFSTAEWLYVWNLTSDLILLGGLFAPPSVKFFNGLATFHLNQIDNSLHIFRELEREAENIQGKRRIIRSYLASSEEGSPRLFHGQVAWINDKGDRGEVFVEELRKNILFLPYEFNTGRSFKKGDSLGDFHIAFNFIGPLADPKTYYKQNIL